MKFWRPLKLRNSIPTWFVLNKLGQNRILRSSIFWFFFVPILVKFLNLKSIVQFTQYLEKLFMIDNLIVLPFSWELLYYSAVFFTIATTLYSLLCPQIVKDYTNSTEFIEKGNNTQQLGNYIIKLIQNFLIRTNSKKKLLKSVFNYLSDPRDYWEFYQESESIDPEKIKKLFLTSSIKNKKMDDAFWVTWNYANKSTPALRAFLTIIYGVGFTPIVYIAIENFVYVINFTLTN